MMGDLTLRTHGVVAANDPGSTRLVYAMVIGLVLVGVLLVLVGVWLIRQTRVDPPMLGPLERMGERDWSKRDGPTQRRLLDDVRPEGARPLRSEPEPPRVEELAAVPPESSLNDLGPGVERDTTLPPPSGDPLEDPADSGGLHTDVAADDGVNEASAEGEPPEGELFEGEPSVEERPAPENSW